MEVGVIKIEGMSCKHCVASVHDTVVAINGVSKVDVDLESSTATIEFDPALVNLDALKAVIVDLGFEAV